MLDPCAMRSMSFKAESQHGRMLEWYRKYNWRGVEEYQAVQWAAEADDFAFFTMGHVPVDAADRQYIVPPEVFRLRDCRGVMPSTFRPRPVLDVAWRLYSRPRIPTSRTAGYILSIRTCAHAQGPF